MATANPAPPAPALTPGRVRAITITVMLTTIMQALDMTIANVALPRSIRFHGC